jgi:8-oxo-dGTP pyrophosphatase MutT (NUDIX family)
MPGGKKRYSEKTSAAAVREILEPGWKVIVA